MHVDQRAFARRFIHILPMALLPAGVVFRGCCSGRSLRFTGPQFFRRRVALVAFGVALCVFGADKVCAFSTCGEWLWLIPLTAAAR
jgi:hypothetical protein